MVQDLGSEAGTWLNGRRMPSSSTAKLHPSDILEFGQSPAPETFKVKLQHVSLRTNELCGHAYTTITVGRKAEEEKQLQQSRQSFSMA